jgi:hypothetical protein
LIIGAITVVSIALGALYGQSGDNDKEAAAAKPVDRGPQIVFTVLLILAFAYGLYDAFQQSFLGGVFTGAVAALMLIFAPWVLFKLIKGDASDSVNHDQEHAYQAYGVDSARGGMAGQWNYVYWLAGFLLAVCLVGFIIAISAFFIVFLLLKARLSLLRTLILTGGGVGFLVFLANMMYLDFPRGLLQDAMELPWPIN